MALSVDVQSSHVKQYSLTKLRWGIHGGQSPLLAQRMYNNTLFAMCTLHEAAGPSLHEAAEPSLLGGSSICTNMRQLKRHYMSQLNRHYMRQLKRHYMSQLNRHYMRQLNRHYMRQLKRYYMRQLNRHYMRQLNRHYMRQLKRRYMRQLNRHYMRQLGRLRRRRNGASANSKHYLIWVAKGLEQVGGSTHLFSTSANTR